MTRERIIVLGAGIQGACAALLLARRGHAVTLVDKAPGHLLRASLRNEGKIHLGFIFVNDPSFRTPSLMLRSALVFASTIDECVGAAVDWDRMCSRPFSYVIPHDSMVPPGELLARYGRLEREYVACLEDPQASYFGKRPASLWRERARDLPVAASVDTAEIALDLAELRRALGPAIDRDLATLYGHGVDSVERTARGFRVGGVTADGAAWQREAGVVVNCLWDGRLKLDHALGLVPSRKWVFRLKYRLLGTLPARLADLPSLSIVLGRYGDLVVYPGNRIYVSWYPACLQGWTSDLAPPASWDAPCAGRVDPGLAETIRREALAGIATIVPGLEEAAIDLVDAGVIFSWGATDIDDPDSELHQRSDVGVSAHDGYYSIDPGKLTCAPLFARELAAAIGAA